jgi:hypothetical protein
LIPHIYECRNAAAAALARTLGIDDDLAAVFCDKSPHANIAAVVADPLPSAASSPVTEIALCAEDAASLLSQTTAEHLIIVMPQGDETGNSGPRYVVSGADAHCVHVHETSGVRLLLGAESAARNPAFLAAQRVRAIVCVAVDSTPLPEAARLAAGVTHFEKVDIEDLPGAQWGGMIKGGSGAVARAVAAASAAAAAAGGAGGGDPGAVLVHCVAGVSRSAACVLGYLVSHLPRPLSLRAAAIQVKRARRVIYPNIAFWRALCEIEGEVAAAAGAAGAEGEGGAFPLGALQLHSGAVMTATRLTS